MSLPVPVPETFDDVTIEWLQAALIEGDVLDAEIASLTVEPMDPSKGLIGDLATLHVSYKRGDGPSAFVLKLPAANPDSRRIGEMLQAYSREVAFYRDIAPHAADTRLATCYYSGVDEDARRWAILLNHIEADAFDFFAGATQTQAAVAVDALADFHQLWWDTKSPAVWMPGFETTDLSGLQSLWMANLPVFVDKYNHVLPGSTAEWVLAFAPRLSDWSARAAREPLTLVHSDYRIDNLLFQGDQVTIIDWQTAMRAPAAMDLSCFIATSLSIPNRRRDEATLIDRYLDRLAAAGTPVDRAWFLRGYDENLLWWMGQFGNNLAHLDPGDDDMQRGLTSMVERVYTAALDRDVARLL